MSDPNSTPAPAPAPVVPPVDPPAPAPAPAPAGARTQAETEAENRALKAESASRAKDSDLHKLKEENKRKDEQLAASRQALKTAGIINDDSDDPKAVVARQEAASRTKERRDAAIERAALRKLMPTGLGEDDADLILGKALRDPRVQYDEATGAVSGLEDVFAALKPTIERLTGKPAPAAPPPGAPPVPPSPAPAGQPMDTEYAAIKTWNDLVSKGATFVERFEAKYPTEFKRLESEFYAKARAGRSPTFAVAARG